MPQEQDRKPLFNEEEFRSSLERVGTPGDPITEYLRKIWNTSPPSHSQPSRVNAMLEITKDSEGWDARFKLGQPDTFPVFLDRATDLLLDQDPTLAKDVAQERLMMHVIGAAIEADRSGRIGFESSEVAASPGPDRESIAAHRLTCWESFEWLFDHQQKFTVVTAAIYIAAKRRTAKHAIVAN